MMDELTQYLNNMPFDYNPNSLLTKNQQRERQILEQKQRIEQHTNALRDKITLGLSSIEAEISLDATQKERVFSFLEKASDSLSRGSTPVFSYSITEEVELLKNLAKKFFKNQDLIRSEALFILLKELIPKDSEIWLSLGVVEEHLQRPSTAITCYKSALDLEPFDPLTLVLLKDCCLKNGQMDEVDHLNESIKSVNEPNLLQKMNEIEQTLRG